MDSRTSIRASSRRRFIRTTGGGIVVAASVGITACTNPFVVPPVAIASWNPPAKSLPIRQWALSHAILAPNPHNRQPWLVSLEGETDIILRIDHKRLLPHTDPFGRQILIGTGAFLALLEMAANERGYRVTSKLFPQGEYTGGVDQFDDRPVAHIALEQDASVQPDPLFQHIFGRRTERGLYDPAKALPTDLQAALDKQLGDLPVQVGFAEHQASTGPRAEQLAKVATDAWAIELKTPHTMMESIELLRVGATEIAEHRDGISLTDPMLVIVDKLGLFDRTVVPAPDSSVVQDQIDDFAAAVASTPAYFWLKTNNNDRTAQLMAGSAYVRTHLALTQQGLAMQPLSQALQEYPEMLEPYRTVHQVLDSDPTTAGKTGQTVQMFCRVGYLAPGVAASGPAPRRGLAQHLAV